MSSQFPNRTPGAPGVPGGGATRGTNPGRRNPAASPPTGLNLAGAVDLSALASAKKSAEQATQALADAPEGVVIDVNESNFQQLVLERSLQIPVVIDFWAEWCGPCKQLSPVLEKLTAEQGGRVILAKIDVDANQQLAAAFQVQSIPSVFLVIGGQVAPLFQGAVPEAQLRQVFTKMLELATSQGITGTLTATGEVEGANPVNPDSVENGIAQPPQDPHLTAIQDALAKGDLSGAKQAAENILMDKPDDQLAMAVLAQVSLMNRAQGLDEKKTRERAVGLPDDPDAQMAMADLEFASGQPDQAFDRLIGLIKRIPAGDREPVRLRVLELFQCLPPDDPTALKGRRDLASSLF
jgi:putative thioredoxin